MHFIYKSIDRVHILERSLSLGFYLLTWAVEPNKFKSVRLYISALIDSNSFCYWRKWYRVSAVGTSYRECNWISTVVTAMPSAARRRRHVPVVHRTYYVPMHAQTRESMIVQYIQLHTWYCICMYTLMHIVVHICFEWKMVKSNKVQKQ